MQTPENGADLLEKDGLHVYGDRHHLISPLAPKVFWVDSSYRLPDPGILPIHHHRVIHVMKDLKHVTALSNNDTEHRAIGIRSNGRPIKHYMLYDYTCISIEPQLPETIVRKLITKRAGKNYLNPSVYEGDKLYFEIDSPLCQGKDRDDNRGLFSDHSNGRLDFPALFSPQEIEDRLTAMMRMAKNKGDKTPEWHAISDALESLQWHHPDFDDKIAHRIAPILIEVAKRNLGYSLGGAHKVLQRMPENSMAPYLDDLTELIKKAAADHGYQGLDCPASPTKGSIPELWELGQLLNAAGPEAANYLDRMHVANKNRDNKCGRIGGEIVAAHCIGSMGPEIKNTLSRLPNGGGWKCSAGR